jgi:myo-inositol-1(or 4)-monophosphatase
MLEIAIRAAREAGQILAEKYNRPHEILLKGLRDIITEADLAAEAAVLGILRQSCPNARLVSEETHNTWQQDDSIPTWYVDPLDGTTNYARGLPMFSVSIAMAQGNRVQCGAVYDPLLDQLFYAERGQGAYLSHRQLGSDQRLWVSARSRLIDGLAMLDWPRDEIPRKAIARALLRLAPQVDAVRSRGSAALGFAGVAAGWADIYFQFTLKPWDVAAGVLLIEEAGGMVTDPRGRPYSLQQPAWLATNGLLHEAALGVLAQDEEPICPLCPVADKGT